MIPWAQVPSWIFVFVERITGKGSGGGKQAEPAFRWVFPMADRLPWVSDICRIVCFLEMGER